MKKLHAIAPVLVIMAILVFGTTAANAGIFDSDATVSETKITQTCNATDEKPDWGVVIHNIVGVVIHNLGGILIPDFKTPTNCGVVIHN